MAKRFTDAEKFKDPWFRKLPPKLKVVWEYMLCTCDYAGIMKLDLEAMSFCVGQNISIKELTENFSSRVSFLNEETLFIQKFIPFQYGKLTPNANVHKRVIERLTQEGIDPETLISSKMMGSPTHQGVCSWVKDKDKEQDKAKEKDQEQDKAKDVLTFLNLELGTNYKTTTAKTSQLINARLSEGFSLDDFKKVIIKKKNEWYGTDMQQYLRPETLFSPKFESYLNQVDTKIVHKTKGELRQERIGQWENPYDEPRE